MLAETIRERLVVSLTKKRERLMKEKEQLDIGDSNAILLHPNQFSIINPASPGPALKRATRGTGRRGADPDESSSMLPQDKRKRKSVLKMPTVSHRPLAPAARTLGLALRIAISEQGKNITSKELRPLSIDRLFTEKELQLNMIVRRLLQQISLSS